MADAGAWSGAIASLAELAATSGWVAEDPELHLLPHLEAATATGPLALTAATTDPDGTFIVALEWIGDAEASRRAVRGALFVVVGAIAETVTMIREPPSARGLRIEMLTGAGGPDSPFASHGHTIRFEIAVPSTGRVAP